MFTDRNGRPCQASDDTLVAVIIQLMPKSLEESVMFAEGFQELYDRLLAYSSTKQSIDGPMDVDALSKGKSKGKGKRGSSGKGQGSKGQNNTNNVECWYCCQYGHYERSCRQEWRENKGWTETGAQSYEHADGWTWVKIMLMGCGKRQTGRQELFRMVDSIEECCSENPRRGEKQKASESDGRRRGTPAPKPSRPARTVRRVSGVKRV